ncbi:MAG: ribonuclease HI family protein [Myxococcota bacterium]|jgi:ribonuclease HI
MAGAADRRKLRIKPTAWGIEPGTRHISESHVNKAKADCCVLRIDGASRGNPGPAAAAAVLEQPGKPVVMFGEQLGRQTNNYAEYRALLLGLTRAAAIGISSISVFSDSELLVKQMRGEYRVKNPGIAKLKAEADTIVAGFSSFQIAHVRREENKEADRVANDVLDGKFRP